MGTIARAYVWAEKLKRGGADSVREIAKAEGVTESYVTRMLRLGFLAPEVVEAIVDGRQGDDLTADHLLKRVLPVRWNE